MEPRLATFSLIPDGFSTGILVELVCLLALSALMSGLSGFGFSAIGALCLWLLPPKLGVPLLMSLSTANQLASIRQLRSDLKPVRQWWPHGPGPYLLGGLAGVPIGLSILQSLPTVALEAVFGGFLMLYALYSMSKPAGIRVQTTDKGLTASLVGFIGGIIGGFTAFPGAAVVVWSGLRQLPKAESRAIVQPYILCLQVLSLSMLALQNPGIFGRTYWQLLALTLPIVLPCTLLGVRLYRSLSDLNFRRVTFMLLGTSGFGLFAKAVGFSGLVATALSSAR
jgi:uncharacterized membrane protein YfcA